MSDLWNCNKCHADNPPHSVTCGECDRWLDEVGYTVVENPWAEDEAEPLPYIGPEDTDDAQEP